MKRFGLVALMALMFSFSVNAQDSANVEMPADTAAMMVEAPVEMAATDNAYNEAADERFAANMAQAKANEAYIEALGDKTVSNRIWVVIILVLIGAIKGAFLYAGYVNDKNTRKPIIYHVWPSTTSGETSIDLAIPEHTFMAELAVFNKAKEKVYGTQVDNSAHKVNLDLSGLEPGEYKAQLIAEKGDSNKVEITRV